MRCEDLLLSCRGGAPVSQVVAHLHDLVDREHDVELDRFEDVLVTPLHRIAANEGGRILRHEDRLASIQRHGSVCVARVECLFVSVKEVCDFLINASSFRCFGMPAPTVTLTKRAISSHFFVSRLTPLSVGSM